MVFFNFELLKSFFIWIRMLPRHTYRSPFLWNDEGGNWQALIWTDVYSYAAFFSRGASGLLDTMIHCMRGTVWLQLGEGGFLGRLAIPLFWSTVPGARSQEQGAGSSSEVRAGLWLLLQTLSESYY